jgi:hypothetical protein
MRELSKGEDDQPLYSLAALSASFTSARVRIPTSIKVHISLPSLIFITTTIIIIIIIILSFFFFNILSFSPT